ncbi:MAG: hypothetical protein ACRCXX_03635, partial [Cetobacterium sp.]|uniref:hypothetical protein n=1 Tax=Cetobacterium sp. TaxID=2071632 RepID=UPI003F3F43AA
ITLFASYIYKNRKGEIQEWIESKKDISSSSAKKTYKDIREALIMSNLPIIVEMLENIYLEDSQVIEYLNWEDHSAMNVSSFIDNYNENIIIIENFYTSLLTPYLEYKEESDGLIDSEVKAELSMLLYSNFQTEEVIIVGSSYDASLIDGEEVDEIDEINKVVSGIQSGDNEGDE